MFTNSILAVSGLLSLAAAIPMAHEHHPGHQRDLVWVTETQEAVVTVPVTQTVWLEPGETAPAAPQNNRPIVPSSHAEQAAPSAFHGPESHPAPYVASSKEAPAPYVPPSSSSSQYVAPAPTPSSAAPYVAPVPSSSSVYTSPAPAPTPTTTSVYTPPPAPAPTTSSTSEYVAPPAPASSEAPAPAYTPPAAPSSWSAPAPAASSAAPAGPAAPAGQFSVAPVKGMLSGQAEKGDLTYYAVGMGSCGETSSESDVVVAVSHVIMSAHNGGNPNNNPLCGKTVGIKGADGNTYHAKIVDTCPGCDQGSLDLPVALFNKVSGGADGRAHNVEWSFD